MRYLYSVNGMLLKGIMYILIAIFWSIPVYYTIYYYTTYYYYTIYRYTDH